MKQVDKWSGNMSSGNKVSEIPNVSWWLINNQVIAMSEMPIGLYAFHVVHFAEIEVNLRIVNQSILTWLYDTKK